MASGKWCLRRQGNDDKYVELLLVEGSDILFRGDISPHVATAVGTRGRRNWSKLPAADASTFRQMKVPCF